MQFDQLPSPVEKQILEHKDQSPVIMLGKGGWMPSKRISSRV